MSQSQPRTPAIGEVWNLSSKPENGSKAVQVISVNGKSVNVKFGRLGQDGKTFIPRSFRDSAGAMQSGSTFSVDQFAEYLFKVEVNNSMSDKTKDAGAVEQTVVAVDENGNEIPAGTPEGKTKLTPQQRAQAILDAEKERQDAKDKKEKEKADAKKAREDKKEADKAAKRAEKLREVLNKTELKEADVAAQFSSERGNDDKGKEIKPVKDFVKLTEAEADKALVHLKSEAKTKADAEKLAVKTRLTDEEASELKNLEKIVEKNLATFQTSAFQIGGALFSINGRKLYRATHANFESYVSERFGLSRTHSYAVMDAAKTYAALTEGEVVDSKSLPSITAAESIYRGVKGLLKEANLGDSGEIDAVTRQMTRNIYAVAVQSAPRDSKTGEPVLSPDHLASTFSVLNEIAKSGVVEIGGQQMPVNLAAQSMDEMITTESAERVAQMKQTLADRIEKAKADVKQQSASAKLDGALSSAIGKAIPDGVTPKLNTVCSFHGRVGITETSDNDIRLECNCVFVSTPEGYTFDAGATTKLNAKSAPAATA